MRVAAFFLVVSLLAPFCLARNLRARKAAALDQFAQAEKMREALNGRPESQRTRRDYLRVIEAYQRVYLKAPTSAKAHDAVMDVAELWAEEARTLNDAPSFQRAIKQYQFLQQEYPGSRYRMEALFTIGQIYLNDLDDPAKAKATFQDFLKKYPGNRLAPDARQAVADIDHPKAAKQSAKPEKHPDTKSAAAAKPAPADGGDSSADVGAEKTDGQSGAPLMVTGIRHWATPDYTRVVIDLQGEVKYEAGRVANPDRIFFDLHDTRLVSELIGKSFDVDDGFLKRIRVAPFQKGLTRVVLEVQDVSDYSAFLLPNPYRLVIDVHGRKPSEATLKSLQPKPKPAEVARNTEPAPAKVPATAAKNDGNDRNNSVDIDAAEKSTSKPTSQPTYAAVGPVPTVTAKPHEAAPTADGDRSLIRALGLKIGRIVVDAGHGGHDTGTLGPTGYTEKELVLDVALRLGKLLETKMGADVVYTRDDDTFVPLETRTAIANQQQADLFISIHANSSRDASARGVETYYLNFTSSPDALEVAARENAVSDKSIHELQDLVRKIALKEKIEESREFAADVDKSLASSLRQKSPAIHDRGVKKAPFIVLIGANMPSILCEISFLSNPTDERNLKRPEYRQKIAEALYKGIVKYVNGLSGVRVAGSKVASKNAPSDREQ